MEKQLKKIWAVPTVESLSVKENTMTGMRRGRSRGNPGEYQRNKNAQIDLIFES